MLFTYVQLNIMVLINIFRQLYGFLNIYPNLFLCREIRLSMVKSYFVVSSRNVVVMSLYGSIENNIICKLEN